MCPYPETFDYLAAKEKENQYRELIFNFSNSDTNKQKRQEAELTLHSIQKKIKYHEEQIIVKSQEIKEPGQNDE